MTATVSEPPFHILPSSPALVPTGQPGTMQGRGEEQEQAFGHRVGLLLLSLSLSLLMLVQGSEYAGLNQSPTALSTNQ